MTLWPHEERALSTYPLCNARITSGGTVRSLIRVESPTSLGKLISGGFALGNQGQEGLSFVWEERDFVAYGWPDLLPQGEDSPSRDMDAQDKSASTIRQTQPETALERMAFSCDQPLSRCAITPRDRVTGTPLPSLPHPLWNRLPLRRVHGLADHWQRSAHRVLADCQRC